MTQTSKQTVVGIAIAGLILAFFLALPSNSHAMVLGNNGLMQGVRTTATTTLSCVQEAVSDRETAVMSAWTDFNTAMVSALTKRTDALVDAWEITNVKERSTALKSLWTTWKKDSKKAHAEMRADRKSAWTEFRKTMKEECRTSKLPKEDSEPQDASGAATI